MRVVYSCGRDIEIAMENLFMSVLYLQYEPRFVPSFPLAISARRACFHFVGEKCMAVIMHFSFGAVQTLPSGKYIIQNK